MKLKTHKSTAKKVKKTGRKAGKKVKFTTKRSGQDHFNARETGKVKRNKRRGTTVDHTNQEAIRNQLPYS